ncbi:hypothetical protein [Paenibacillus lutrae]|uniref:Uncharacterized protein n=1 Tax=Paenibacillus lutrae TaxID=2078573 RepID=A0A7X3JYD1_9BACL|nr:hypothetical protein [Paenibacillus lutrae]MVO98941.1 hypothetical protein [Paenibacillus lutrae]
MEQTLAAGNVVIAAFIMISACLGWFYVWIRKKQKAEGAAQVQSIITAIAVTFFFLLPLLIMFVCMYAALLSAGTFLTDSIWYERSEDLLSLALLLVFGQVVLSFPVRLLLRLGALEPLKRLRSKLGMPLLPLQLSLTMLTFAIGYSAARAWSLTSVELNEQGLFYIAVLPPLAAFGIFALLRRKRQKSDQ